MSQKLIETEAKKNITVIGGVVNLVLSILKIGFGWLGQSHALIADGFHSLSDLLSDGLVYYASHHAGHEADEEHPYGHARFETLATVILGSLLVAVASAIIWGAIARFFNDEVITHGWLIIVIAILSVLAKEVMFHLTMRTARETRSDLLKANAWHHRSDAISSFVVLIGVGLEMAGFHYFDSIAALIVGLMVVKIGVDLVLGASKELVDTALDADVVEQIKQVILSISGVRELHFLRTRKMGETALVDVHILVDPKISVSEGHLISETVRLSLINEVENIGEVMVHIDPEDDEMYSPSVALPLRKELLMQLDKAWEGLPEKANIKDINLHYLEGNVEVEIVLPLDTMRNIDQAEELSEKFIGKTLMMPQVESVKVLFS
ncbi:MAG: cation diffusion facilitator family transporter [Cycloclasticus sp.]|jgi:cation diffusion facilitator family transporter|nr:MAG: cation diffusion facilitator family transporter [Cycloclasticus sp. Phe_18]MDF1688456.1 cation diffusion facilitator family transporter [Cycloclasticus sp.]MEE4291635.1 cation diffusion facilitator family transporter [Cycloclasticus sp.]